MEIISYPLNLKNFKFNIMTKTNQINSDFSNISIIYLCLCV